MTVKEWLWDFLNTDHRGGISPDGRPLFAYQMSKEEFEDLRCLLSTCMASSGIKISFADHTGRAFVLYGAEWWRRNFEGGQWRWDLITRSIGWEDVDQKYLTPLVLEGVNYWQREIVRYKAGNAYLTTLVLEGGIPLMLLQQQGASFTRYLKAIIGEHAKWSGAGLSAYSHAVSCQRVLTAKTLRKEQIFQLAATIVDVIYSLSEDLESRTDPFGELNAKHPGWLRELPMAIEDDGAKDLVDALLKEAQKKRSSKYERFLISRYLTQFDGIWEKRASLEVPESIPVEVVAEQLHISITNLPSRMELIARTSSFTLKVASLMRVQREQDEYRVSFYRRDSLSFDLPFTEEIKCFLQSGGQTLGTYAAEGAEAVDIDMPLLFVVDNAHDWRLLGMGSLVTRVDQGRVILPIGAQIIEGYAEPVEKPDSGADFFGDNPVYDVFGEIRISLTDGFKCRIRLGANRDTSTHYSLVGKRLFALEEKGVPVFSGLPTFLPPKGGIKPEKFMWRSECPGSEWVEIGSLPPLGCVHIRAIANNECLFATKLVVLPSYFSYSIRCSESLREGTLALQGLAGAEITYTGCNAIDVVIEQTENISVIACRSQQITGGRFPLNFGWSRNRCCTLKMPFPGKGARFTKIESGDVCGRQVPITELLRISAQAVSPQGGAGYKLVAELHAADIDRTISRSSMYFEREVPPVSEGLFDLPLVDLYSPVKELFSYSADLDAVVRIELISSAKQEAFIDIVQFDGELAFDPEKRIVTFNSHSRGSSTNPVLKLLPFDCDRDCEQLEVEVISEDGEKAVTGWNLNGYGVEDTGLVIAEGQLGRLIRPCVIYMPTGSETGETYISGEHFFQDMSEDNQIQERPILPLTSVWRLPSFSARRGSFKAIFDALPGNNLSDDWAGLVQYVERFKEAHPDCLDVHESLIDSAGAILGVIFRSQPEVVDIMMEWEEYIPLRLWMLPLREWRNALQGYLASIEQYGDSIIKLEQEKLIGILKKIKELEPNTVLVMNQLLQELGITQDETEYEDDLRNAGDIQAYIKEAQAKVAGTMFGRPEDERWPGGIHREIWNTISKNPLWLDAGQGYRMPFLDAPIYAAFCVAKGIYLDRQYRAFIAAMRNFDNRSFDDIYLKYLVLFLKLVK